MKQLTFILILFLLFSCKSDEIIPDLNNLNGNSFLTDLSVTESGLHFSNNLNPTPQNNILEYLYYYNGGGVGVGDFNSDGLEDIFFTANEGPDRLFYNKGSLHFEDMSAEYGIAKDSTWSSGVTVADVNGDGHLDIYVCKVNPVSTTSTYNHLYINDGNGKFSEQANGWNLDFSGYSTHAVFFDYDNDDDLDMYLLNHSVHSVRSYGKTDRRLLKDSLSGDRMYENRLAQGENRFVDVTNICGIYSSPMGYGLSVATADFDSDGYMDIYVANDFHENDYIYINNGDRTFTEQSSAYLAHGSKFTMGVDIMDMNGDGYEDIFTTDMLPYDKGVALRSGGEDTDQIFRIRKDFGFDDQFARNHFQLAKGGKGYCDVALLTDTYATDWSWACLLQDFDNNGMADIFISNGIVKRPNDLDYIKYINNNQELLSGELDQKKLDDVLNIMPSEKIPNILFTQNRELEFSTIGESKIGTGSFSNGAAYADFDNDGDLDIVVNNINEEAFLYRNDANNKGNYISFVFDKESQSKTIGYRVEIFHGGGKQSKSYSTVRGYQSSSTHRIHFGLGTISEVDSVYVISKTGRLAKLTQYDVNKLNSINLKDLKFTPKVVSKNRDKFVTTKLNYQHIENDFKDYNTDKLIPELLSREGPAIAVFDFNGDDYDDVYIGGARYQEAQLLIGKPNGKFGVIPIKDFISDSKYEDVDAEVFDFEGDGDMDLYIVSGGNDVKELDKLLEDRIYINDKGQTLRRLPLSLPHTNGSTVSASDYDRDGDVDLFVGARSIPYSYGLKPFSFLLRNKGDLTYEIAFKNRLGMVTDSQWKDMDGDGDDDLVLCGDWMPVTCLINNGEEGFTQAPDNLGLKNYQGLWNEILLHDFNGDSITDIVAGNAGLNFKWKADENKPVTLLVSDIDNNGQTEPIISHDYFGAQKSFASLDHLIAQAPIVKKQFIKYSDYSNTQSVQDIDVINKGEVVEALELTELRSMIFISNGKSYDAIPLPKEAQFSTIQSFCLGEDNEIIYLGNHLDYLTELGMSASNEGGEIRLDTSSDTLSLIHEYIEALPAKYNSRKILPLNNQYIVVGNNDYPYLITKN